MNRILCLFCLLLTGLLSSQAVADRPLFVFDFVFKDGPEGLESYEDQADLLQRLGYPGICVRPVSATPEMMDAFEGRGIKVMASYFSLMAGTEPPASLEAHFEVIKRHQPFIWLAIKKAEGADDEAAASTIRKVVDLAAKHGLETVLYPHAGAGYHTDTVKSCERIYPLVDREKLGLSFNLCHYLAQTPANQLNQLEATLKGIGPRLKLVQISGANSLDHPRVDWKELIKPLGQGDFDVARVIRILDEVGYEGPVNLNCYKIAQPPAEYLAASMKWWRANQQEDPSPSTKE